ncbi:hypothetical protein DAPPUDRAFT_264826 [Daphnia pulex]|uniref:Uncharacterized protein n=1 Tax=Daphnia pulex TaxID=6669 RepID=E9HSE2_DAPPU|nr:hypothetical protein DAPPUDRAFT_264826 [Daphnia pulex]|eukprot:EFX65341.1 hypothetical protein DAPPUDRAFT_264826 [Daphnia pulex]
MVRVCSRRQFHVHQYPSSLQFNREPLTATDEEKARKYALAYLSKHQIQILSKNAPSSDPIRIKYDE